MSATKFLRENAYRFSDRKSLIQACIETGIPYKSAHNAFDDIQRSRNPIEFCNSISEAETLPAKSYGLSESELRQKHDVRFIIKQAAEKLEKGIFIMDADFVKQCNMRSQTGYRQFIEASEFSKYKGRAGGVIYWSHPESISKMKSEGILN